MHSRGNIQSCTRDILTEKMAITVLVEEINVEELNELSKAEVDIDIQKHKENRKRSLDANAYFHVLLGKIADKLNVSKPYMKNILLGKYGQREYVDGKPVELLIRSDISMENREDIHVIPYEYGVINGVEFTHYYVARGSHTYNTEEMACLINGVIEDAKELGIETMTPEEVMRLEATWQNR